MYVAEPPLVAMWLSPNATSVPVFIWVAGAVANDVEDQLEVGNGREYAADALCALRVEEMDQAA